MRLRRLLTGLVIALVAVFSWTSAVQAHVLESDGAISAVLHVPPDDAPVANQEISIGLAFASSDPKFDLGNYQVSVILQRNNAQVLQTSLQPENGSSRDGTAPITFPEPGAYQLIIKGTPIQGTSKAFELSYSVRATPAGGSKEVVLQAGFGFWAISLGSLCVLVLIARNRIQQGGRYITRSK